MSKYTFCYHFVIVAVIVGLFSVSYKKKNKGLKFTFQQHLALPLNN